MEMGDQYGLPDLRQFMAGRTHIPTFSQATDQFSGHRNLTTGQHYEIMMLGRQVGEVLPRGVADFRSDSTNSTTNTNNNTTTGGGSGGVCGFEMEGCIGGDGGNGRWPRQETLTLLEIRSLLDPKFKEANQKGPLWDEVSRIMAEEHGYQRSGKKCREKFENLYKYYKKTKESKSGRQDGKHYRFFRQLEALYGELSNPVSVSDAHVVGTNIRFQATNNTITQSNQEGLQTQKHSESLSISNSSEFHTSSSEDDDNDLTAIALMDNDSIEKKKMKDNQSLKRGRKSWKVKIRDFVDSQMKKLMERQEAWLEKMLKTLEYKEQERMSREEEWRKQEVARIDREHKFWDNERAWFKARDAALMEALKKLTGREVEASSSEKRMATESNENVENQNDNGSESTCTKWTEAEISGLIHLRTSLEPRFQQGECSNASLWEEISLMMASLGYSRSSKRCEEKWESEKFIRRTKECNKKRKENYNQGGTFCGHGINDQGPEAIGIQSSDGRSPSNSNAGTIVHDSFRFLMAEGENINMWENYGMKLNKGEN